MTTVEFKNATGMVEATVVISCVKGVLSINGAAVKIHEWHELSPAARRMYTAWLVEAHTGSMPVGELPKSVTLLQEAYVMLAYTSAPHIDADKLKVNLACIWADGDKFPCIAESSMMHKVINTIVVHVVAGKALPQYTIDNRHTHL